MTDMNRLAETRSDKLFNIVNMVLTVSALVLVLFPLIFIINASFSDPNAVVQGKVFLYPVKPTLEGYSRVFKDSSIWIGYRNSLIYMTVGTAFNIVLTVLGAYPLSRKDFYGRQIITIFFVLTMFFKGGMIPTYLLMKDLGFFNNIMAMIFPNAVVIFNLIITRNYIETTIPDELKEAAQMDGCTNFKFLLKIVLPLSLPIIAVIGLYYGIAHWNNYMKALLYITREDLYPLQIVLRSILLENQTAAQSVDDIVSATERMKIAEMMKYSLIIIGSLPLIIVYPFVQRFFVKGMLVGSVKG